MLSDQIKDILVDTKSYSHCYCRVVKIDKGFQLNYGQMYEPPVISFSILMALCELFGTKEIDVDDFAEAGCETCDYWSDYGHEIQIYNPTKNVEELQALVGTAIFEN